jgi:hypothetical protein
MLIINLTLRVAYAEDEAVLRRGLEAVGILADSCSVVLLLEML